MQESITGALANLPLCSLHTFKSRRRQHRRTIMPLRYLLHFDFRKQNGRSGRRNRNGSGFSATFSIKHIHLLAGKNNAVQGRQRSANDVYATDKLVWTAIWINLPNHERHNLECLGHVAQRQGKTTGNVLKVKSVSFFLFLDLLNQLGAQFRIRDGPGRAHNQVPLASYRHEAILGPPMAVGMQKAFDWHARHQELLEYSIGNQFYAGALLPFIIIGISAAQLDPFKRRESGIVFNTEEGRQYRLIHHLGESLPFVFTALSLAFQTVSNHLMEKHGGSTSGKQRRATVRLDYRSGLQLMQVLRNLL